MNSDVFKWMILLTRRYQQEMARRLAPLGVSPGTHGMLLQVCGHPGISQDELAERGLLNKSTVARACAQLERDGFVVRRKSERDRRVLELYPTGRATAAMEQIVACKDDCAALLTEPLDEEERGQLQLLLERVFRHNADRQPEQPAPHTP